MSRVNHALGTARVVELFDTRPVELRDVRQFGIETQKNLRVLLALYANSSLLMRMGVIFRNIMLEVSY